jgi:hypothetical protein
MRKDIRERREREIYRQKRRKKAVLEYTFATLALGATVSLVAWFITFIMKHGG